MMIKVAQHLPISILEGVARLNAFIEEFAAELDVTSLLSAIESCFDVDTGVERDIDAVIVRGGGWDGYRGGDDCRDENGDD
jgi:hypothetical protein